MQVRFQQGSGRVGEMTAQPIALLGEGLDHRLEALPLLLRHGGTAIICAGQMAVNPLQL